MLEYQKTQQQLTNYLRNPQNNAPPAGISKRRLAIYEELFFNNIEGFIAGGFPVFKSLCSDSQWQHLIRQFLDNHVCQTPYFLKICEEFLLFIQQKPEFFTPWPYAFELCHYEWLELAIEASDAKVPEYDPEGDFLSQPVQLSPWLEVGVYQWPVHEIGPDFLPSAPSPVPNCLLVYRNRQMQVAFLQSNPATLQLLAILNEQQLALPEALEQLAPALGQEVAAIENFAKQTLSEFQQLGIVLGTAKSFGFE